MNKINIQQVKNESNSYLSNNWCLAIASFSFVLFILFFITYGSCIPSIFLPNTLDKFIQNPTSNFLPAINLLLSILLAYLIFIFLSPSLTGVTKVNMDMSLGKETSFKVITDCFNSQSYMHCVKFWGALSIRYLLYALIFILPLSALYGIYLKDTTSIWGIWAFVAFIVLSICSVFLFVLLTSKYFLAPYIHSANPELSPSQCINHSKNIMKNNKSNYFSFILSFTPWFLLLFFVFTCFYVIPVFSFNCSILAKTILSNYTRESNI